MILTLASGERDGIVVNIMIFGLTDENWHRMKEGMPIHVDGRKMDMPAVDVVLMAGRTDEEVKRYVEQTVRESGGQMLLTGEPAPVAESEQAHLLEMTREAAARLGTKLVYLPTEGLPTPCADCGEWIVKVDGAWTHGDPNVEHRCRYGEGCAHPHEPYVEISQPNQPEQGET